MGGKSEGITLSEFLKEMTESLNRLKEPAFSKEELEKRGITSSFQNFPCTFDICHTKEGWRGHETTRIKSSLKHILTSKCSSHDKELVAQNEETYLTYVEVEIEHHTASSWFGILIKKIVRVGVVTAAIVAPIWGGHFLVTRCLYQKKGSEISWLPACRLEQIKLVQKAEMSAKYESRGK